MPEAVTPTERPFAVYHEHVLQGGSRFVPTAQIVVRPELRTTGLLSVLSDRQARLLLALLTFISASGDIHATASQVAAALGVPVPLATLWLLAFARRRFQGYHLIYRVKREEGHPVFALSWQFLDREHPEPPALPPVPPRIASREEVIAASRASYSQPREVAEQQVMVQLGHAMEELLDTPEGLVYRRMHDLHISPEDTKALIGTYGLGRVLQQVEWLPRRRAKHPAKYLVAAIKGNYAAPMSLRDTLRGPVSSNLPVPFEEDGTGRG